MKKKAPAQKTAPVKVTQHRQLIGDVVGVSAQKTIRVRVSTVKTHAKYRKQYSTARTYAVHDETGKTQIGDKVLFQECRPISKTKRWRLISVAK